MKHIIGYVVWKNDAPVRNVRSEGHWYQRKEPIKVYQTEAVAKRYMGKDGEVKPVFVDIDENESSMSPT